MVAFSLYQNCWYAKGSLGSIDNMKVGGERPRSLLAGGYEPLSVHAPLCPRNTVKRSIFPPTTNQIHPNLVSLCSNHFCACRKKYPIRIYSSKLKISASESSKWAELATILFYFDIGHGKPADFKTVSRNLRGNPPWVGQNLRGWLGNKNYVN